MLVLLVRLTDKTVRCIADGKGEAGRADITVDCFNQGPIRSATGGG